ncbi:MAG: Uma2 family endonuclease [Thiomargarita sp.]|nr:Uma2 family endonuclease [Thiomargarita sp.]
MQHRQPIFLKSGSTYSPRRKRIEPPTYFKPEPPDDLNESNEPEFKSLDHRKVDEAEYWEKYYENGENNESYEWNNGYLEVKPVSELLTVTIYDWFTKLIDSYLENQQFGKKIFLGFGFRLALPDKTTIRKPDYGVILNTNPVPLEISGDVYSYSGICDLCVEALSDLGPKEIKRDTETKFREYAAAGVKEYYILYANDDNLMRFYRLNDQGVYIKLEPDSDGIIRSSVLLGFQFRIADLHRRPSLEEMACDPVYEKFAFPAFQKEIRARLAAEAQYQKEKKVREFAEKQAEQERQEKESALQQVQQERQEKESALQQAEQERQEKESALQQTKSALQQAEQERQEKELALQKIAKMAELLRKLDIEPNSV